MNPPSPPLGSTKEKSGYPLSPTNFWKFWLNFFSYCILSVLLTLEVIARIRISLPWIFHRHKSGPKIIIGRDAEEPEGERLAKRCMLKYWLGRPSFEADDYDYMFSTRRTRVEMLLCISFFAAFEKFVTVLTWMDRDPEGTAIQLRKIVKVIRKRAEASNKFSRVFEKLIMLLKNIEESSAADISSFVREWSNDMASIGSVWHMEIASKRLCSKHVPQALFEASLATFALFHACGGGLEEYYIKGHWKKEDRYVYGALTLLLYFALDKCYPESSSDLVKTKGWDLEQVLLVNRGLKFVPVLTRISTKDEVISKNLMMWDITRNICNDFVESSWSVSCLERVIWMLQHGLRNVNMELYESLKKKHGQRRVDMTHLSALSIMTLSVAGLMQVRGFGDGPYQIASTADAKIEIHGDLPPVTLGNLVGLNLVCRRQLNSFCIKRLPGCDQNYKAVIIGDSIKFVPSAKSECFTAKIWQRVI